MAAAAAHTTQLDEMYIKDKTTAATAALSIHYHSVPLSTELNTGINNLQRTPTE